MRVLTWSPAPQMPPLYCDGLRETQSVLPLLPFSAGDGTAGLTQQDKNSEPPLKPLWTSQRVLTNVSEAAETKHPLPKSHDKRATSI